MYHIFFNNISFIFLYCAKLRLLKIHRSSPLTICNMSLKAEISRTIQNIMHLTITRSLANNSITDLIQYHLTTFQTVKVNAMSEIVSVFLWIERLWGRHVKLLLASAPSYGKVHNVVYCYAYFCLFWHHRRQRMICEFFRRRGLVQ